MGTQHRALRCDDAFLPEVDADGGEYAGHSRRSSSTCCDSDAIVGEVAVPAHNLVLHLPKWPPAEKVVTRRAGIVNSLACNRKSADEAAGYGGGGGGARAETLDDFS